MSSIARDLGEAFDWRSLAVLRRNALVFSRTWKTAFLPPALEPVIYFLAFGLGLGTYVGTLSSNGRTVPYASWVAPGLLAYAAFSTPFFEALYASYVRMFYQKTWDGILATQVELRHIVWGEILWSGVRGMMNTAVVALVLAVFHGVGMIDIAWAWLPVLPLVACVIGWAFGALALIFTAIVPAIDHMNYPVFLIGVPLGVVSNTYFPFASENAILRAVIAANPVYHLAEVFRGFLVGRGLVLDHVVGLVGTWLVLLVVSVVLAQRLMRRRVLGE